MNCTSCGEELSPSLQKCPVCNSPNPLFMDAERTFVPGVLRTPDASHAALVEPESDQRILGFVAIYADSATQVAGDAPSIYGRVIALRKGEILFMGRPGVRSRLTRPDGSVIEPSTVYLFPFSDEYQHVSRLHLTIEMVDASSWILTDLRSTNGTYLTKAGKHVQGESVTLHGDEILVLGVDPRTEKDPSAQRRAMRSLVQLLLVPQERRAGS